MIIYLLSYRRNRFAMVGYTHHPVYDVLNKFLTRQDSSRTRQLSPGFAGDVVLTV